VKHQVKTRRRRIEIRFPFAVAMPAEHCCTCDRAFASREGLDRHISLHRWQDIDDGDDVQRGRGAL